MSASAVGGGLPTDLASTIDELEKAIGSMEAELAPVLSVPIAQLRAQASNPLNAAELDLTLAYTLNSLFWVYLRTQGVSPADHAVTKELDRIKNYMVRLKQAKEPESGAPQMTLNQDAAKRFITAALASNKPKGAEAEAEAPAGKSAIKKKKSKKTGQSDVSAAQEGKKSSKKHKGDKSSSKKKKRKIK